MKKNILIATCGTSSLTNHRDIINNHFQGRPLSSLTEEEAKDFKERIIKELQGKDITDKKFGAEINSTYYLFKKENIEDVKIYLIVSDSIDGRTAGEVVKYTIENSMNFEVEIREIEKLNITKEHDFAIQGLRNLSTEIAKIIKKHEFDNIMISPIGGLKAQIFMVGLIAQVFKIPAYYLYENSTEIVKLLPMPITIDRDLFIKNLDIISRLKKESILPKSEIQSYINRDSNLRNILEDVRMDNTSYFSLSPLGEMIYDKLNTDVLSTLPKDALSSEKLYQEQYKGNEAHAEQLRNHSEFQRFIKKVINAPYVTKVIINYFSPDNKGNQKKFTLSSDDTEGRIIKFQFNNSKGMLEGKIFATEQDDTKLQSAIINLYHITND